MNGTTMWSCDTELCTNGAEASKCWVFIVYFSIYSTSWCRCHAGTVIPRLRGHTLQISQVVRTVRHGISYCAPTIHWKCDARMQNRSPPTLWNTCHSNILEWSLLWMARALACFDRKRSWSSDWWLKKVRISAIFSQIFWNFNKINENNRQTNLWRSNSYI